MSQFPSTEISTFSGLVVVGTLVTVGSVSGTVWMTTGTVIRKMMSSTNMTSTSGVVLISFIGAFSSDVSLPILIPIGLSPYAAIRPITS